MHLTRTVQAALMFVTDGEGVRAGDTVLESRTLGIVPELGWGFPTGRKKYPILYYNL